MCVIYEVSAPRQGDHIPKQRNLISISHELISHDSSWTTKHCPQNEKLTKSWMKLKHRHSAQKRIRLLPALPGLWSTHYAFPHCSSHRWLMQFECALLSLYYSTSGEVDLQLNSFSCRHAGTQFRRLCPWVGGSGIWKRIRLSMGE